MNIEENIKNILYYFSLISGSIMCICLFIIITIRLIGFAIDHLKVGNVIRECLVIWIKQKNPSLKIKKENIKFERGNMNIKEAIEKLKNTDIYNLGHNDRFEELRLYEIAIDTVLNELDNRIPLEVVEKKIQEYKGLKEIDMQAYEEQIKPLKELLIKE